MAKIRTLKPQILEDEKTSLLSDTAFRLFTSMIVLADDNGNVRADVRWLQAQIWWAHKEPPNVLTALLELTRNELIEVYGVRGGTYAHLRGWTKHQRIDNAGKGRVPEPNDPDSHGFTADLQEDNGVPPTESNGCSPRIAANRRENRLDLDRKGRDMDGEFAEKTPRPQKAFLLPEDWQPSSSSRERAGILGVDCSRETERFRNHYRAKGLKRLDWDAMFLNWISRSKEFAEERAERATGGTQTRSDLKDL